MMMFSIENTNKCTMRPNRNISLSHTQIQVPLNNTGLNCLGPLVYITFLINTEQCCELIFFSLRFLNTIFSPLAYFILKIQYIIHMTYKIMC